MLRGSDLSMAALGCRARMVKERNGEPERGSERESIKILLKNTVYEPNSTRTPPQASLAKPT
jgi:hypothetical protein